MAISYLWSCCFPIPLPEKWGPSALRSHKPIWNLSSSGFLLPGSQSPETPSPGPIVTFIHVAFSSIFNTPKTRRILSSCETGSERIFLAILIVLSFLLTAPAFGNRERSHLFLQEINNKESLMWLNGAGEGWWGVSELAAKNKMSLLNISK